MLRAFRAPVDPIRHYLTSRSGEARRRGFGKKLVDLELTPIINDLMQKAAECVSRRAIGFLNFVNEGLGGPVNLPQAGRLGSRTAERWQIAVMIDARDGDRRQRALATDISVSGIRLKTSCGLRAAQTFWVKFENMEARQITVLWVEGFTAGCAFAEPLAEYVLDHIVKTAKIPPASVGDRRAFPRS